MPSNPSLKAALARKRKQLTKAKLKAKHSKEAKDRFSALDRIKELRLDIARLEQQITMNEVMR